MSDPIKVRLERGETVLGTLSLLPEPALAELAGASGLDFYVLDTEHAANDGQSVTQVIRACQAVGTAPFVRLRGVDEQSILWVLDSGAEGLLLPMLEDGASAHTAYRAAHFPPYGNRGLCSSTRASWHGARRGVDFEQYMEEQNDKVLLVGLIETVKGFEALDEILDSPLDVIAVGRGDLCIDLGVGYQPGHPEVERLTTEIVERTLAAGKKVGMMGYELHEALRWADAGVQFLLTAPPEMILAREFRGFVRDVRAARAER